MISVGVDAGGTWIRAALNRNGSGRLLRKRRRLRPGVPIERELAEIFRGWGLRRADSLTIGARGAWKPALRRSLQARLSPLASRVRVYSDMELAWHAALGDAPGIVVVSGTGSAAYGRTRGGKAVRRGGLGPLLGDEGSCFWIGKTWLESRPQSEALAYAHRPDCVPAVSALAQTIIRSSDPRCREITRRASRKLAGLARETARALGLKGAVPLSWQGGMFHERNLMRVFLRDLDGRFEPRPPLRDPEVAAALFGKIGT